MYLLTGQNVGYNYVAGSLQVGGVASTTATPASSVSDNGLSSSALLGTVLGAVAVALIVVVAVLALTFSARERRRERRHMLNSRFDAKLPHSTHHVTNPLYNDEQT